MISLGPTDCQSPDRPCVSPAGAATARMEQPEPPDPHATPTWGETADPSSAYPIGVGITKTPRLLPAAVFLSLIGLISVSADAPDILVGVADAYVAQDESGRSWTIGNDGIVFRVGLNATGVLVPLGLERPGAEVPWTVAAAPGLSFQQQGRRLSLGQAGFPFRTAHAEEYLGGVRLTLVFDELTTGLRVTRSYVCYPQAPAIETWSTFEAIGLRRGVPISDIGVWQLTVPVQEAHWVTGLHGEAGDGRPLHEAAGGSD